MPTLIVELDLNQPVAAITPPQGYTDVWLLLTLHGLPVGEAKIAAGGKRLEPDVLVAEIVRWAGWTINTHILEDTLLAQSGDTADVGAIPVAAGLPIAPLRESLAHGLASPDTEPPCIVWRRRRATWRVSLIIATRDGAERLGPCLDAVEALDYPDYEVLIVDNASRDDATRVLVESRANPQLRYIFEPHAGVSRARNRAMGLATGDIIAFTDDDARPARLWLLALVAGLQHPSVSLVAGRLYPAHLDNWVQDYCETYWGFDRGFERKIFNRGAKSRHFFATNTLGGAHNMAVWRRDLERIGGFDPSLGRGTASGSATDMDVIHRFYDAGYTIGYEPTALVWLEHPAQADGLARHEYLGASGVFAAFTKWIVKEPHNRRHLIGYAVWAFCTLYLQSWLRLLPQRNRDLVRLRRAAVRGALDGPRNYVKAVRQTRKMRQ